MSSLDKLVPLFDGTNYREWSMMMESYLQMQDCWDVVNRTNAAPIAPRPTRRQEGTGTDARIITVSVPQEEIDAFQAAFTPWRKLNDKALGAITLRLAAHLHHHRVAGARETWQVLANLYGDSSYSATYSDFKQVLGIKLSGNNPIPEIKQMATLFGRLTGNKFELPDPVEAMILLAAIPSKWDNVAQLYLQRTDLQTSLTFDKVRVAIQQEFERTGRPVANSAQRLSAVKRKTADPSYRSRLQQPQAGPSSQQQQQRPKGKGKTRRAGKQEQQKRENKKSATHSHLASSSMVVDLPPPTILVTGPSRATPSHTSIASFNKDGISYRKAPVTTGGLQIAPQRANPSYNSVWPSLNQAREICDNLAVSKSAKNLRPLEQITLEESSSKKTKTKGRKKSERPLEARLSTPIPQLP